MTIRVLPVAEVMCLYTDQKVCLITIRVCPVADVSTNQGVSGGQDDVSTNQVSMSDDQKDVSGDQDVSSNQLGMSDDLKSASSGWDDVSSDQKGVSVNHKICLVDKMCPLIKGVSDGQDDVSTNQGCVWLT